MTVFNDLISPVGPKRDHLCAQKFIHDMFMSGIPQEKGGQFFPHFTCATDTMNIKRMFDDVRNTIMVEHMASIRAV